MVVFRFKMENEAFQPSPLAQQQPDSDDNTNTVEGNRRGRRDILSNLAFQPSPLKQQQQEEQQVCQTSAKSLSSAAFLTL